MQCQCCVHHLLHVLLHLVREPSLTHVALEDTQVDMSQGVQLHTYVHTEDGERMKTPTYNSVADYLREADGKHTEMSLET